MVTSTSDAGPGTLRDAMLDANALAGVDAIEFGIPRVGAHTITLASTLPAITEPLSIDGYTQAGAAPASEANVAVLKVAIDATATAAASGLWLTTDDSLVRGLVVHSAGFPFADGIIVEEQRNRVEGNFVGTDINGVPQFGFGNNGDGVQVEGDDNVIGGTDLKQRNVIAGNSDAGVDIDGTGSTQNLIQGNLIGTDATGTLSTGPGNGDGVVIAGDGNVVGGTKSGARNVISGNAGSGIELNGDANLVNGNAIGTDITATEELGNDDGVSIAGDDNIVGGSAPGAGNVVSGNTHGVAVSAGTGNRIEGNLIGPNGTGFGLLTDSLQTHGVVLESDANSVGGAAAGEGNVVSGNSEDGVELIGNGNTVLGNKIGTTPDGDLALPNDHSGIVVSGDLNTIGGPADGEANTVSGNDAQGILIRRGAEPSRALANRVRGNLIGTDVTGTRAIPNGLDGVLIAGAGFNKIGGANPGEGNVISSNQRHGVRLQTDAGAKVDNNLILGNRIGTGIAGAERLGNGGSGVSIEGGDDNHVGATQDGGANTIAFNDQDGVTVETGANNPVIRNSIFDNAGNGIDLDDDGATANDPSPDADAGANALQNYPVIREARQTITGGRSITRVDWRLTSQAWTSYRIEFFASPKCHVPDSGQGKTFLGAIEVTTDAAGVATATASGTFLAGADGGPQITATATRINGRNQDREQTSEFSPCTKASPAPPTS